MYKQSSAILALFLGQSQATLLNKHHKHHQSLSQVQAEAIREKAFAEGYATGESMGGNLTLNGDVGHETYKFAQQGNKAGVRFLNRRQFAEGYATGESMGGNLTLNGDVGQETYKFAQAGNGVRFLNKNDWAEGYNTGESMGGNLTINGDVGQETYKFAQKQNKNKFASGYGDRENFGETIRTVGPERFIRSSFVQLQDPVSWQGAGVAFPPVPPVPGFVGVAAATAGNVDKKGSDGKASIIDAQASEQFLDDRTEKAQTRLPYASTLMQLEDPVSWQGAGVAFPPVPPVPGFVGTAVGTSGNLNLKGANGKAAIIDAQESEQFLDDRTEKAQTRLPYASTLLQLNDPVSWQGAGVAFPPVPPVPGFVGTAAATASNTDKKGADGKASVIDAQESEQFLDDRTEKANTRLPYASTLLQLDDPVSWQGAGVAFPPVPPIPGFVAVAAATAGNVDKKGADGKEAIIDAQESEQFLDDRTTSANERLPYASTLIQLNDDDVSKMEGIESGGVPLDFHFVHIATEDGELVQMI